MPAVVPGTVSKCVISFKWNDLIIWSQGSRCSSLTNESTGALQGSVVYLELCLLAVHCGIQNSHLGLPILTHFQLQLYAMAGLEIDCFLKHLQLLSENSIRFCFVFLNSRACVGSLGAR